MFAIGAWMLRTTPVPGIDVYVFHQEASAALDNLLMTLNHDGLTGVSVGQLREVRSNR